MRLAVGLCLADGGTALVTQAKVAARDQAVLPRALAANDARQRAPCARTTAGLASLCERAGVWRRSGRGLRLGFGKAAPSAEAPSTAPPRNNGPGASASAHATGATAQVQVNGAIYLADVHADRY